MRTFEHFPKDHTCKICGTSEDKPCILAPIDGTFNDGIEEAEPVHVDCLGEIRFNKEASDNGLFYIIAKEV